MSEGDGTVGMMSARVLIGTCSWADASLVKETDWYPKKTMTAAERLAYYAATFPVVAVDSTYYFPPTPELAAAWVERTPPDFTMNVKAWSLLTGHPTFPDSLWPDLQAEVPAEHRGKRRLYAKHLPPSVIDEAWHRFRHSLEPLQAAGKLGAVLFRYPRWFGPRDAHRSEIADSVRRLDGIRVCVELRHARWLEGGQCESTLSLLEDIGASFVCVDEPAGFPSSMPPVVAATASLAVVRFDGRNREPWEGATTEGRVPSAAERFRYRYTPDELEEWVPRIRELAATADEVHVLMNNCWRDDAVVNAAQIADLLQVPPPLSEALTADA